jgi:hypothetical protein
MDTIQTAAVVVVGGDIHLLQAAAPIGSNSHNLIITRVIRVRVQWSNKQTNITAMPFSNN